MLQDCRAAQALREMRRRAAPSSAGGDDASTTDATPRDASTTDATPRDAPGDAAPRGDARVLIVVAALFAVALGVALYFEQRTPFFDASFCEHVLPPQPPGGGTLPPPSRDDKLTCGLPPPGRGYYPTTRRLEDVVRDWPVHAGLRSHHPLALCRFDWANTTQRAAALAYRRAEVPFQVYNVPSLADATARWANDTVLAELVGPVEAEVSTLAGLSHGPDHFMYFEGAPRDAPTRQIATSMEDWLARPPDPPQYVRRVDIPQTNRGDAAAV